MALTSDANDLSDAENTNTLNDSDEEYEPPKKKRKTMRVSNSKARKTKITSKSSLNNSNSNNNTNSNSNKCDEEKEMSSSEIAQKTPDTSDLNSKTQAPKLKLKAIKKNVANYSLGPNMQIYKSRIMEFKVLFASNQICIRISDFTHNDYQMGIRGSMGFSLDPMFSANTMIATINNMRRMDAIQIIQRILIKFEDIMYLKISMSSGNIYIQLETQTVPEIKYQQSSGKRSGYTILSDDEGTDITKGNYKKYAVHSVLLTQGNQRALDTMVAAMKEHPTLKQLIEKSQDYEFDKNKELIIKPNKNAGNDEKKRSKSKTKSKK